MYKRQPLKDAVQSFESIPSLVAGILQDDRNISMDSSEIRAEAEMLFGDDQVARAWQAVFDSLAVHATTGSDGRH